MIIIPTPLIFSDRKQCDIVHALLSKLTTEPLVYHKAGENDYRIETLEEVRSTPKHKKDVAD